MGNCSSSATRAMSSCAMAADPRKASADRVGGALWGMLIGDALAMPTHWFYGGERQVKNMYAREITGYVKPVQALPGSIMNLSSTSGGGRGSSKGDIVGTVINHGKKQYWTPTGSFHYHCTLQAGENTLEAQLCRLVMRSFAEKEGNFDPDSIRKNYVDFMTTPGSHNDCYASTCHRMFFANLQKGIPPERCPDNDNHNVDVIDGLAMTVPVALALAQRMPTTEVQKQAMACAALTRQSNVLGGYVAEYADLLTQVAAGTPMPDALRSVGQGQILERCQRAADPVVA